MSNATLQSFDPFASHPFTNSHGVVPVPPHPQSFATRPVHPPSQSSLPNKSTPPPLYAPQPRAAAPTQGHRAKPIFTPFQKDRASPDPLDALLKKSTSTQWGNARQ